MSRTYDEFGNCLHPADQIRSSDQNNEIVGVCDNCNQHVASAKGITSMTADDVVMCCDRPMIEVPARPQEAPIRWLLLCQECGECELVEPEIDIEAIEQRRIDSYFDGPPDDSGDRV